MLPPVIDLPKLVLDLRCLAFMAGFSQSLSHLLKLDFVLLGNSNFLLIILQNKEQSERSESTLLLHSDRLYQHDSYSLLLLGNSLGMERTM